MDRGDRRGIRLGEINIHPLRDGLFRLDGGAMFGIVPRVLWEKECQPDGRNRILLGINPLLVEAGRDLILIDTGIGDRWDERLSSIYGMDRQVTLLDSLSSLGVDPSDITIVVNTHLHFDHAGGNLKERRGLLSPTFPRARYVVQKVEWEDALHPNERTRGSYREEDFLPLKESGHLELITGDLEIARGVRLLRVSGHTRGTQIVLIESGGRKALFLSDVIPTTKHIRYPYIAAYDLYPLETLKAKKEILKRASEEGWLLIFEHDPHPEMGYVEVKDETLQFRPLEG